MNYAEHHITLDINSAVSHVCVSVKRGDTARRLLIHLSVNGYPYHINEGCYAVFTARKPDGKVVYNDCTIDDCTIIYELTEQTVAVEGVAECEIKLYGGDSKLITSASFVIVIDRTVYNEGDEIESTDEFNELAALIAEVKNLPKNLLVSVKSSTASHSPAEIKAHADTGGTAFMVFGGFVYQLHTITETKAVFSVVNATGNIATVRSLTVGEDKKVAFSTESVFGADQNEEKNILVHIDSDGNADYGCSDIRMYCDKGWNALLIADNRIMMLDRFEAGVAVFNLVTNKSDSETLRVDEYRIFDDRTVMKICREYSVEGSGSADWSVNDESGEGYIHNRTHWREDHFSQMYTTGLDVTTAPFVETEYKSVSGDALKMSTFTAESFPLAGDSIMLTWNGLMLNRTAEIVQWNDYKWIGAGNLALLDAEAHNSGESYVVLTSWKKKQYVALTTYTSGTHDIKLSWYEKYRSFKLYDGLSYSLNGVSDHRFNLGNLDLVTGAVYELTVGRSPGQDEGSNMVYVNAQAVIDCERGEFIDENGRVVAIIQEDQGFAEFIFDATAIGCPSLTGKVTISMTTKDPSALYDWHRLEENYLPKSVLRALKRDLPTKVSQLENDKGYLTAQDIPDDGVLIVTIDFENKISSHSPEEILAHLDRGGSVCCRDGAEIYHPLVLTPTISKFEITDVTYGVFRQTVLTINRDKQVTYTDEFLYDVTSAKLTYEQQLAARRNLGGVQTVNGVAPDANGNVQIETGDSMGGADWNAAEGEPGHVLNRTHWVEGGKVEILAETTMTEENIEQVMAAIPPLGLVVGDTYTVKLNGVEYFCVAESNEMDGVPVVCLIVIEFGMVVAELPPEVAAELGMNVFMEADANLLALPFTISITHNAETVHKLPGKFLPNGVPYVEQGGTVEILPKCQPEYIEDEGMFVVTEGVQELSVGETYIVRWNGTEYTCVGQDISSMMPGAVLLGDGSNFGLPSTGEPFMIGGALEDGIYALMAMPLDGTTELTISITHNAEVVHKLDGKFLPDGVPYVEQGNTAVILPETTFTADEEDPGLFGIEGNAPVLEIGKTYTVNWNGTEYIATAVDGGSLNAQMAGTALLVNEGADLLTMTGAVFLVLGNPDKMMMMDVAGATELTISIMSKDTICHKLDNRCLDMDYIKESLNVAADTVKVNLADIGLEVVNLGRTIGTTGFANLIRDVVYPIIRGAKVLLDFKYNFIGIERTYHGYVTDWEVVELYGEALTTVHVLEGNDIYLIRLYISIDMGRVQTTVYKLAAEVTTTEV